MFPSSGFLSMMALMRRWIVGGAIGFGGVGGLIAASIEVAYWLDYLDPVVPHYLNEDVLRVWPTAGWLFHAAFGGTGRAIVILIASLLGNALLYALVGAIVGAVAGAINRVA